MDKPRTPIAVLGGGSWGTALAVLLAGNGQHTLLWARDAAQTAEMASSRCNSRYLPGISLPPQLEVHSDLDHVVRAAGDVLVVVPTQGFRALLGQIAPLLSAQTRVAWASKGLEPDSGKLLHEVAVEVLGTQRQIAVISGPTFAREVALGLPTAITVASAAPAFAVALAARLGNGHFRAYTSEDMIGVELGGAVKNVMAIAAGIADGLGFGANTRAALVTRGLAEMMRMGVVVGGQREACAGVRQVAEGVKAAREVQALARKHGVEMPITEQVCHVLYDGLEPRAAVQALLQREQKAESL